MKSRYFLMLILAASLQVRGLNPASNNSPSSTIPSDPLEFFEMAHPRYDLSNPNLKPWHLKASYRLNDFEGKPVAQGVWEYWWASPKVHRSTLQREGLSRTDWTTESGTFYLNEKGDSPHYFEREIGNFVLRPEPNYQSIKTGNLKLEFKTAGTESGGVTCLNASRQSQSDARSPIPPMANHDYYCYDRESLALISASSNSVFTQYSRFVKLHDHYFARQITAQVGRQILLTVSVDTVDEVESNDVAFVPPASAIQRPRFQGGESNDQPSSGVMLGRLLKKVAPIYPELAKSQRQRGSVIIAGTIGKDGKASNLEIIGAPSKLLADAAVEAVKHWEYKPYLLNGEPVEVETTITLTFDLR